MCAPTVLARAVTALNEEQSSFAHTVNDRRLPGLGGPAGSGVTVVGDGTAADRASAAAPAEPLRARWRMNPSNWTAVDRKSTRLNSSHLVISYAVFCLKKKKKEIHEDITMTDSHLIRVTYADYRD